MRLFVAIDLPKLILDGLARIQRDLRGVTNSARWVPTESIHLTLKFIGEVPESRLNAIDEALTGLSWKPFTVSVYGIGFFPGARSPRVFWAGLEASTMDGLALEVDARLERIGFDKEKRAFRPHVTLARAREMRIDRTLVTAAALYDKEDFGSFTVDRFYLYQSTLKPAGAVYNRVKEYPLESRNPSSGR